MTKICWLAPPSPGREVHQLVSILPATHNTLNTTTPTTTSRLILLFQFYPCQARPGPQISKHCMSSTSNFAIEFPIGFYLSHQVKIIMRELWRLAGRHYVFVTPTVSVSLSQSGNHVIILACLLCNITPTLHPATKHNYPRKSGTTNIHSERMIHFNALSLPPSISSQYLSECQYLKVRIPG